MTSRIQTLNTSFMHVLTSGGLRTDTFDNSSVTLQHFGGQAFPSTSQAKSCPCKKFIPVSTNFVFNILLTTNFSDKFFFKKGLSVSATKEQQMQITHL